MTDKRKHSPVMWWSNCLKPKKTESTYTACKSIGNAFASCISVFCFLTQLEDEWMTCDFTSFSRVFQSYMYQDDGRMIMKDCMQWNPVYG